MTRRIQLTLLAIAGFIFVLSVPLTSKAQERSPYVISAKAGGINAAMGNVTLTRGDSVQPVSTADELDSGDRLTTGVDGRAEMLLMPGSYLRLAENSEILLSNASLDSLQLKLIRGIAQIEMTGDDDSRSLVQLATPQTTVQLERKGLYRVSLPSTSATLVRVRKGRAQVGMTTVKDGKEIVVDQNQAESISKFDKKSEDAFDVWNAQRAQMLADANRRLSRRSLESAYAGFGRSSLGLGRGYNGYWVYDPFFRSRTFLPYYLGWSSPYGHRYHFGLGFSRYGSNFGVFGPRRRGFGGIGISVRPGAHRPVFRSRGGRRH